MGMSRVAVVIPTYNEAENLVSFVERSRLAIPDADLLIVDDDSPDGTGTIAERLAAASDHVQVLHRPRKSGLASAYVDGFRATLDDGYEFIFQMDADGSHDPGAMESMRNALADADLVIGSRYVAGGSTDDWPWRRRVISRGGSLYARALLRISVRDVTSGFKCWRADLLRNMLGQRMHANGYAFQIEMTYRAIRSGAQVVEVPIRFVERQHGSSKFDAGIVTEAMRVVAFMGGRDLLRVAARAR